MPVTLLCPHRRHLPRRVQAFMDWVSTLFKGAERSPTARIHRGEAASVAGMIRATFAWVGKESKVFQQHFWLFCGLWCGGANSLFVWLRLRQQARLGAFSVREANAFALVLCAVVLTPMLVFWGLQQSGAHIPNPNFLTWPNPQKQLALGLQAALWGAMVYWVFFKGGAQVLSAYLGAGHKAWMQKYFFSVPAFKLMTVSTVLSGIASAIVTLPA